MEQLNSCPDAKLRSLDRESSSLQIRNELINTQKMKSDVIAVQNFDKRLRTYKIDSVNIS